jgi:hypothetical protein
MPGEPYVERAIVNGAIKRLEVIANNLGGAAPYAL